MKQDRRRNRRKRDSAGEGSPIQASRLPVPAHPAARFCILFLILLLLLAGLSATPLAERFVHAPLSRASARLAVPVLSGFGTATAHGNLLVFNSFSAEVEEACDGVLPCCIFAAAVLAFPSTWKQKLWGILLGVTAIFIINIVRVITLMLVGSFWPDVFERVHIYVWQALVIALSLALWVFWVERFVGRGPQTDA
jgi:exosortase H (IPTLxxWG-CTERM-specific)